MKKTLITGIIILLGSLISLSQTVSFKLIKCSDTTGNRIVTDNLGNIYLLEKSSLRKFDANGVFLYSYSELADGLISAIDVSDPLKIIILNADFAKIKFLDNKLNVKNTPVSLSNLGFNSATLAAASYESGFWIFDPLSNQLVRFDNNLQLSQTSGNISDLIGHGLQPDFMLENDNILYLNDPLYGILLFDRYGTYLKTIPIKNIRSFHIFNDMIFYTEGNALKSVDIKTYEEKIMQLPLLDEEITAAAISSTKLSLITKTKFCIFALNK
jgi:hypothetical protein